MKTTSIKFNDFMSGNYKVKRISEIQKGKVFKVVLITGIVCIVLVTGDITLAASVDVGDNIDIGAKSLYKILLRVGKWIIIAKGAVETLSKLLEGDHPGAKKGFLTYLVVYVILHGLPFALDQVDGIFEKAHQAIGGQ
jgi:hypothetical protein